MGDVGLAIQRAEDKTEQMKARAGALDELMASGALDDMVGGPRDDIQLELDRMGGGHDVDAELARLKGELSPGSAPREIAGSGSAADGAVSGSTGTASGGQPAQPVAPAEQPQAGDGA